MATPHGIPAARRSSERLNRGWRDYQQPLRWDWSAFGVVLALLAVAALFAVHVTGRL